MTSYAKCDKCGKFQRRSWNNFTGDHISVEEMCACDGEPLSSEEFEKRVRDQIKNAVSVHEYKDGKLVRVK